MKCVVNWSPLRIRVRSRNTQPHLNIVPNPIAATDPPQTQQSIDHSTSTTCTQLIYSLQSYFFKHQPSASPYVTPVGIWPASSPPSLPSQLGYGNIPCVPLLPLYPVVHCDTSASPLPSLTLTLTKHHLEGKKNPPSLANTTYYSQPPQLWRWSRYFRRNERSCLTTYGVDPNINQFLSCERILAPHPHTRL